ncbi:MAG: inverse autotransporter beta domain-containing protein [Candidatus Aquirickettsiella sp.]
MRSYKRLLVLMIAFSLTNSGTATAALPPRLSANAYASDYTVGAADLMLPMAGDRRHNFYLDPNVAYATDNQGYADLGLGYRWIKNDAAIYGVYLFGGYTRIDNNARLWVANPGIEALGSRWDAHLNAYFPMGDRHTTVSIFPKNFFFTGHSQFSDLNNLSQYAGAGGDISVGGQLFPQSPLKAYVGSYFFNPAQTNNIWGGAAGLEYWLDNNIKVFASYSYDSLRHSTGAFGIGVEWGGMHTTRINPTLEERMTDPVGRYLADLGRGSAIPSRLKAQPIFNTFQLLRNNIAFFSQTGGPNNGGLNLNIENCTFENPCGPIDFTNQGTTTLNSLLPNTRFAFEDGAFAATDIPGGTNPVSVRTGQSITSIGQAPATLVGGLILEGDNSVDSISLQPTASTATGPGITVLAGDNQIKGTQIGSTATPFATGLRTLDSSGTLISTSNIFASSVGIQNEDDGFTVLSASNLEVDAGTNLGIGINSLGNSFTSVQDNSVVTVRGGDNSVGIRSASSSPLATLVDHSAVNVTGGTNTLGIEYIGSSGLNLQNASINVRGANNSSGVQIEGASSGAVTLTNSPVTVVGTSTGGVTGIDISSGSTSTVTLNASPISVTGGDNTTGLNNFGNGSTTLSNGSVVTVMGGTTSRGIVNLSPSLMTIQDSTVNVTGDTSTVGIDYLGSGGLSVQRSRVNVTGAANSSGVLVEGSSSGGVNLGNSFVTVDLGSATGGRGINIAAGSTSTVTTDRSQIKVTGGDNTIGVNNEGNGTTNFSNQSVVTVIGGNNSTGIRDASSSSMTATSSSVKVTGGSGTNGIDYVGSGGINLQGSIVEVTGSTNSNGVLVEGSSSGAVNLVGSPVTVNLGSATGGRGINILTGSTSTVTVGGSAVTVTGGSNTIGLNNEGNGSTSLTSGSVVNVTGGSDSIGIVDSSSAQMTLTGIPVNVTGGDRTIGIDYLGSGGINLQNSSLNLIGTTDSIGIQVEAGSSGTVSLTNSPVTVNLGSATGGTGIGLDSNNTVTTVSNSAIKITGGNNTIGLDNFGNGTATLSNGSAVTVIGGNDSVGIVDSSSAQMTLAGSSVNVTGGINSIGIDYVGTGGINLQNSSLDLTGTTDSIGLLVEASSSGTVNLTNSPVTVKLGSATGGMGISIVSGSAGNVTMDGSAVTITGGNNTIGLNNEGNGSTSLSNKSAVAVTGGNDSTGIFDSSPTQMTVNGSDVAVTGNFDTAGVRIKNIVDNQVNILIDGQSAIFVEGQNGFAYGLQAIGINSSPGVRAATAEIDNSQITVGGNAATIGLFAVDDAEIGNNTLRLIVTANNNQAIGALAESSLPDQAFIHFSSFSTITVTGDPSSLLFPSAGSGVVTHDIFTTTCILNGVSGCPFP